MSRDRHSEGGTNRCERQDQGRLGCGQVNKRTGRCYWHALTECNGGLGEEEAVTAGCGAQLELIKNRSTGLPNSETPEQAPSPATRGGGGAVQGSGSHGLKIGMILGVSNAEKVLPKYQPFINLWQCY